MMSAMSGDVHRALAGRDELDLGSSSGCASLATGYLLPPLAGHNERIGPSGLKLANKS